MADVEGSCLCGGVRYQVRGAFEAMAHCHCVECRKASGADFATNATVSEADLEWIDGETLLSAFESSPGNLRYFCGRCGSPVMKKVDAMPGKVRLRLGLLEGDPEARPALHVFVGERTPWTEIRDTLPQFEGKPEPRK